MTLQLSDDQRAQLERWARGGTTPQRLARRSRIVLLAADGRAQSEIAQVLGISRHTVRLWIARFTREGAGALVVDRPGRGRKPVLAPDVVAQLRRAYDTPLPHGRRVSLRQLASRFGVAPATVHRALKAARECDASTADDDDARVGVTEVGAGVDF